MPKATITPNTSRRSALRGIGLTAIAAGLAVPALADTKSDDADAELIRLCATFDRLEQARLDLLDQIKDDDEREIAMAPFHAQQEKIVPLIWATPARTMDGVRAKVRSWVLWAPELLEEDDEGDWMDKWRIMILRDLLEGSAVA
jgi:hypothetical protein